MRVTLNCDMGESYGQWQFGDDAGIMPHIDYANIACGFHAADPVTMAEAVALAVSHGVAIGAHPSLPDREGFGRREMRLKPSELKAAFLYQIGALTAFLAQHGVPLSHVKPHGIIYGMAARELETARAIAEAANVFGVPLFGLAGTCHETAAAEVGIPFVREFFADLAYGPAGELIIPRKQTAVDIEKAAARLKGVLEKGRIEATDGTPLTITADSICIHSDPPNAREVAVALRRVIDDHNRTAPKKQ
jgi:5-oxoprolinase (ATP-hydrolysing) subunit A